MLKGKKVLLRPIRVTDAKLFAKWMNDPEVNRFILAFLPISAEGEENWIRETQKSSDNVVLSIVVKDDSGNETAIGNCGLHNISWKDHRATFGIVIGENNYWEGGLGTEAAQLVVDYGFNQLNLHRISSSVFSFNERSIKMHLKLGFEKEGIRKELIFKNGQYHDEVVFGLLRKEWKK